ncbi:MAG: Flp family type IVb pilin [Actinoplanes sp.]
MFEIQMLVEYIRNRFAKSDEGASAVEYGLLVSLIAAAIVGLVAGLGTHVGDIFKTVTTKI